MTITMEELEEIQKTLMQRIEAGRELSDHYKRMLRTSKTALRVVNKQLEKMQGQNVA